MLVVYEKSFVTVRFSRGSTARSKSLPAFRSKMMADCQRIQQEVARTVLRLDKQQRAVLRQMPQNEILELLVEELAARAELKGWRQKVQPLLEAIMHLLRLRLPVLKWSISQGRYKNLCYSFSKMTCLNMIKVAFGFAGLNVAAYQNLQQQLNILRFEKPTDATDV
eukprot:Skav213449  [mRNA]  locus=scaffold837:438752:444095:- [translate_table: standard]